MSELSSGEIIAWAAADDVSAALEGYSKSVIDVAVSAEQTERVGFAYEAITSRLTSEWDNLTDELISLDQRRAEIITKLDVVEIALGLKKHSTEDASQEFDLSLPLDPFTLIVRGCHKVHSTLNHPSNRGYITFRQEIGEITGTAKRTAGQVAAMLTGGAGRLADSWREMVIFHDEDQPEKYLKYKFQHERPARYPKAITINDELTLDEIAALYGAGEETARTVLHYLHFKSATRSYES